MTDIEAIEALVERLEHQTKIYVDLGKYDSADLAKESVQAILSLTAKLREMEEALKEARRKALEEAAKVAEKVAEKVKWDYGIGLLKHDKGTVQRRAASKVSAAIVEAIRALTTPDNMEMR